MTTNSGKKFNGAWRAAGVIAGVAITVGSAATAITTWSHRGSAEVKYGVLAENYKEHCLIQSAVEVHNYDKEEIQNKTINTINVNQEHIIKQLDRIEKDVKLLLVK